MFKGIFIMAAIVLLLSFFGPAWICASEYTLPDTGIFKCYDEEKEIPCPSPGLPFYGQDAQYDGPVPAYQDNGNLTVTDMNTGLIWQKRDIQNETKRTWEEACDYCAGLTLGGYSDWRLPNRRELISIIDYGRDNPAINTTYFPECNPYLSYYWSSTSSQASDAWVVQFGGSGGGKSDTYSKRGACYVRCVRGATLNTSSFRDNGNGTITDTSTKLMWQQGDVQNSSPRSWEESLDYCECLSLAGYSDWRLPNIRELESIVDCGRYNPAINPLFDNVHRAYSSSSFFSYPRSNWVVDTGFGAIGATSGGNVRCVRSELRKPTLSIHSITVGNLSSSNTKDYYELDVGESKNVTINLLSTDFDGYLRIRHDATNNILAENDDGHDEYGLNARLSLWIAGKYIIEVTSYNGQETGCYTLVVRDIGNKKIENICSKIGQGSIAVYPGPTWDKSKINGNPDDWIAKGVTVGGANCFGRCGTGCLGLCPGEKYTQDCLNHDACCEAHGYINDGCMYIFKRCGFEPFGDDCALGEDCAEGYSTLHVERNGNCGNMTPCYSSIQEAIKNAVTGSLVFIAEGTYSELIILNQSKSITLTGGWDSSFQNLAGTTTLRQAPRALQGSLKLQRLIIKPE